MDCLEFQTTSVYPQSSKGDQLRWGKLLFVTGCPSFLGYRKRARTLVLQFFS